jgi:prevent-host-death family protein
MTKTRVVNIAEAKARLSEIVEEAASGREVVIARRGVPIVRLVPVAVERRKPRLGTARGLIEIADDFDAPLEDFDEYQ